VTATEVSDIISLLSVTVMKTTTIKHHWM